jgi:hypothetical protein
LNYKDILPRIKRNNTSHIKFILSKLLESYKKYRNHLEFHGNISQSAILPKMMNQFDTNPTNDPNSLEGNNFLLTYYHQNMLTVKEWIKSRHARLKNKSK